MESKKIFTIGAWTLLGIITAIALLFASSASYRHYSVWSMEMQGKANLAKATQDRQIQVEQAKSEKEAAKHIAEAIKTVGAAAQKYPEYRNQVYIQAFSEALTSGKIDQIIYVPTEAGIPILEASRVALQK